MSRSLNPNATQPVSPPPPRAAHAGTGEVLPPRRNVLAAVVAAIIGAFVGLVPVTAGVATFLDPLFRRKKAGSEGDSRQPVRVASLDALPADGTPVQVPVVADLTDAWNREPNKP